MRRTLKWLLRIAAVACAVGFVVLLIYTLAARSIAESKILSILRAMGVDEATVQVRSVGTSHLQITNLNLGDEAGLRIGAVGIDYSLTSLSDIHAQTLELIGVTLDLRIRDGKVDVGPLANIKGGEDKGLVSDGVPFDKLIVRSSMVTIEWRDRRFTVPFEATLVHQGAGVCEVEARVSLMNYELPVRATIDFTAADQADTTLRQDVPAGAISFAVLIPLGERELTLSGAYRGGGLNATASLASNPKIDADDFLFIARYIDNAVTLSARVKSATKTMALAGWSLEADGLSAFAEATVDLSRATTQVAANTSAGTLRLKRGEQVITLAAPNAGASLTANWSPDKITLEAKEPLSLGFDSLTSTGGAQPLNVKPFKITAPVFSLHLAHTPAGWRPDLRLSVASSPLEATSVNRKLTAASLGAALALSLDENLDPRFAGALSINDGAYLDPDAGIGAVGINISLPITMRDQPTAKPFIEVREVRYKKDTLPAFTGSVAVTDGVLKTDASWAVFESAPAAITATLDLSSGFDGQITAKIQGLKITDDKVVAGKLEAAEPYRITGTFDVDARLSLTGGKLTPLITFTARDAMFASGKLDFVANGIDTTITIDSLWPLRTRPNQRLAIRDGHLGSLNYRNAIANFRLDAADAMVLELAAWSVGEKGRFWLHAARFNPMAPVLETQVFIEDMSVAEWIQILQDGEIVGEGYLYGRLPIRIDQSRDPMLTFGEGFLYAKPGKGWVRVKNRESVAPAVYKTIEEAVAGVAKEAQRRLIEAMYDYEFDTLKFDFIRQGTGLLCRIYTSGRGRTGLKQEVGGLTINIHNFGALLSERVIRNANSLGAIDDAIKRVFE